MVLIAETALLVLVMVFASPAWTEAGSSQISVVNVSNGSLFSKDDDVQADSELVDVTLDIAGNNVPDGTDLWVKVQGMVNTGQRNEPGIVNELVEMNDDFCSVTLPLFPGENTISIYRLALGASDIYTPSVIGHLEPSVVLNVSSSYQGVGDDLTKLITEDQYNQITASSRNNAACREGNRKALGLSDSINGQWYYTYDNFIAAMRKVPNFAGKGDLNTRKLELAAFFANVAQETGSGGAFGAGCAIQEGYGSARDSAHYGGLAPSGAGFCGRGPLQLSYDYNYKAYGADMGVGDQYFKDPDILTKDAAVGLAGSMWFWNHREPQWDGSVDPPFKPSAHEVMVHSWKPTKNDIAAGRILDRDFGVVINIINGGVECSKSTPQAQNRVTYYRAIAGILGAVIPASQTDADLNCANQKLFNLCPSSPAFPECK